jgi:hypothetical protein
MVRFLITLLLIAVFFLGGMLLGVDRGQPADGDLEKSEVKEVIVTDTDIDDGQASEQTVQETPVDIDEPSHFTQKVASFLETVLKGFYEMVVMIFYQFAEQFF